MNEELIKEVFSDGEYVNELLNSESWEAAQASLKEKNLDFSVEELKEIMNLAEKKENEELSDDELEQVSGGFGFIATVVVSIVASSVVSAGASFGIGSVVKNVS